METKKKILIIDDDPDIVESINVVLEAHNYQVLSSLKPEEGIEKAKLENPDLIFLDVMMTHMDSGFDTARVLKSNTETKAIPIVILTALKEKTGFDFSLQTGDEDWLPVNAYLEKPVKPQELLDTIEKFL